MDVIYYGNMGYDTLTYKNRVMRRKRDRKIRFIRKCLLFVFTLIAVLAGTLVVGSTVKDKIFASEEKLYEYYDSITVKPGDTLWSIANEYGYGSYGTTDERVEELMTINKLSDTSIHSGEKLIIKYYSDEKR